jgi:hypothetical protein
MSTIYLIEIVGLQPVSAGGALETLRYCTGVGYVTKPAETPANTIYYPRVISPGSYERHMWAAGATRGAGSVNAGVVELANLDGGLDYLLNYDFDGRAITILRGDQRAARASFTTVLVGTLDQLDVTESTVTARIRDRRSEVADKLLVTTRYGGTNVLPAGIDGTIDDIKGQTMPLVLGSPAGFEPTRVNSSKLIYHLSADPVAAIGGVWEGGNAIPVGTSRANAAALEATAPAAATYDYSLGSGAEGCYIRLGSSPSLPITASANLSAAKAADIANAVLQRAGVSSGDILGVAALNLSADGGCGHFVAAGAGAKVGDVLDLVLGSVGASWTPNRLGKFNLTMLVVPTGPAVVTFTEQQLLNTSGSVIVLQPTADQSRGIPTYQVKLGYARTFLTLSGANVAGAVTAARKDYLANEYRYTVWSMPAIWDPATSTGRNPTSQPMEFNTCLMTALFSNTEASRLINLYGARRLLVTIVVPPELASAVDLGTTISIATDRFGLAGKFLLVIGMIEDFANNQTTIYAWG